MNREIIPAARNRVWDWPAVLNFVLGGAGAGFFLSVFLVEAIQNGIFSVRFPASTSLLPPALVIFGFLALTAEAGRPLRGIYLLRNLRSSWMSREILIGFLFVIATIIALWFPSGFFKGLSVFAAFALLLSHGFIFFRSRAITAWNNPLVIIHYISSGFLLGTGMLFVLFPVRMTGIDSVLVFLFLTVLVIDALIWFSCLRIPDKTFMESIRRIRRSFSFLLIIGPGRIFPFLIFLCFLAVSGMVKADGLWPALLDAAGVMIISGTILQRRVLILEAFTSREITMGQPEMNRRQGTQHLARNLMSSDANLGGDSSMGGIRRKC